jgi:hypothetical protein
MTSQLMSIISRALFVASFVLVALAVWEKVTNLFGFTLWFAGGYAPSRLLELAAIALLFVVALQLREIKQGISSTGKST